MSGRTAVITGGASGLGEACARRLAADGTMVWLADVNLELAEKVAADIAANGGKARAIAADVASEASLCECAETVARETGAPDILITSAGILEKTASVLDTDMEVHDRVWSVNYRGTVLACRLFGRMMREAGSGAIVTIGSINSYAALPLPAYCPSKTAILRLTELLAVELGRHGVRVNGIAPTYVLTPAMQARIDAGERDPAVLRGSGAIDMFVMPHHIADVAAFLCSDAAAAVTGVMMPVDSGWRAATPYKSFAGGVPWND